MFSIDDINLCLSCSFNKDGFCEKRQLLILITFECEFFTQIPHPKLTKEEKQEFRELKAEICKQLKEANYDI